MTSPNDKAVEAAGKVYSSGAEYDAAMKKEARERYGHCVMCGCALEGWPLETALRDYQKKPCKACYPAFKLKQYACCDKAKQLDRHCVCMYATTCPEHGERHHGTHD